MIPASAIAQTSSIQNVEIPNIISSIVDAQTVTDESVVTQTSDDKCDEIQEVIEKVCIETKTDKEETVVPRNKVIHKKSNSLKGKHEWGNSQQKSSSNSFEVDEIKKFETKVYKVCCPDEVQCSTGLSLEGPSKVRARKSFLFTESSLTILVCTFPSRSITTMCPLGISRSSLLLCIIP